MSRWRWTCWIGVFGVAALAAGAGTAAFAEAPHPVAGPLKVRAPQATGLRVYVDPLTGELISRPTPEQTRALATFVSETLRSEPAEMVTFPLRHGGTGVFLDGALRSSTRVRRAADGSLEIYCLDADSAAGPAADSAAGAQEAPPPQPQTTSAPVR